VLSDTHLPDGTGFALLVCLAGLPVKVIDDGKECVGLPAFRPSAFASLLEEMATRFSVEIIQSAVARRPTMEIRGKGETKKSKSGLEPAATRRVLIPT